MSRTRVRYAQCAEPGCREHGCFEYRSLREERADDARRSQWRCVRHWGPPPLTPTSEPRVTVLTVRKVRTFEGDEVGFFWDGANGLSMGPGWKAFADDFAEGDQLEITVRVVRAERGV